METEKIKTTERWKIRTYILGLIYRGGGSSVKVPSSAELAARFGVARRTARIALEGLVREGWLIGRRGVGTFTNPARAFGDDSDSRIPLIGLIYGYGDNFYYDTPAIRMLSEMGLAAAAAGFNVRFLTRMSGNETCLFTEIRDSNLDGLVWASNSYPSIELLEKLRELGIRIVTIDRKVPGFSSILFDSAAAIRQLAALLAAEKRNHIVRLCPPNEGHAASTVRDKELMERFLPACRGVIFSQHHYRETLAELLSKETPDTLIIGWSGGSAAVELLRQHNIDPITKCRIVVMEDFADSISLPCLVLDRPYRQAADAAVAEIARQLAETSPEPVDAAVNVVLKYRNLNPDPSSMFHSTPKEPRS